MAKQRRFKNLGQAIRAAQVLANRTGKPVKVLTSYPRALASKYIAQEFRAGRRGKQARAIGIARARRAANVTSAKLVERHKRLRQAAERAARVSLHKPSARARHAKLHHASARLLHLSFGKPYTRLKNPPWVSWSRVLYREQADSIAARLRGEGERARVVPGPPIKDWRGPKAPTFDVQLDAAKSKLIAPSMRGGKKNPEWLTGAVPRKMPTGHHLTRFYDAGRELRAEMFEQGGEAPRLLLHRRNPGTPPPWTREIGYEPTYGDRVYFVGKDGSPRMGTFRGWRKGSVTDDKGWVSVGGGAGRLVLVKSRDVLSRAK